MDRRRPQRADSRSGLTRDRWPTCLPGRARVGFVLGGVSAWFHNGLAWRNGFVRFSVGKGQIRILVSTFGIGFVWYMATRWPRFSFQKARRAEIPAGKTVARRQAAPAS